MKCLPCPFCGKLEQEVIEELLDNEVANYGYGWAVYCACGAQGAAALIKEEAIALWNTRANALVQQAGY